MSVHVPLRLVTCRCLDRSVLTWSFAVLIQEHRWKLGQLSPGSTVTFKRISWAEAQMSAQATRLWTEDVQSVVSGIAVPPRVELSFGSEPNRPSPILQKIVPSTASPRPAVTFRQVNFPFCVHSEMSHSEPAFSRRVTLPSSSSMVR